VVAPEPARLGALRKPLRRDRSARRCATPGACHAPPGDDSRPDPGPRRGSRFRRGRPAAELESRTRAPSPASASGLEQRRRPSPLGRGAHRRQRRSHSQRRSPGATEPTGPGRLALRSSADPSCRAEGSTESTRIHAYVRALDDSERTHRLWRDHSRNPMLRPRPLRRGAAIEASAVTIHTETRAPGAAVRRLG
jgi:hypothetical protein